MRKGELCYYTYRRMSEDYLFSPELISERLSNCCNFPRRSKIESPSVSIIAKVFHFRYGVHAYTRTKQLLGFCNSPSFSNSVQFATAAINLPIAAVVSRREGGGPSPPPSVHSAAARSMCPWKEENKEKEGCRRMQLFQLPLFPFLFAVVEPYL